jgi:hypothetical protein
MQNIVGVAQNDSVINKLAFFGELESAIVIVGVPAYTLLYFGVLLKDEDYILVGNLKFNHLRPP